MLHKKNMQIKKPIHIVTQLWGETYVNLYANYVLESLMSDGNLPALSDFQDIVYEIYTTPTDKLALEANANFKRIISQIKNWIVVRFVLIKDAIENPYVLMSTCHRQAIAVAEQRNAAIIFLQPDVVVGNNSLRTVRDKILAGKRLVMSPGLRAVREGMVKELEKYTGGSTNISYPSSRELVNLAISNLHPISQSLVWRFGQVNSYCSHLYWLVGDSSLYARCAHMHPLMVYPKIKKRSFAHTIDWDYFYRACPDIGEWFVPESSDEICLVELSGFSKFQENMHLSPSNSETIISFLDIATRKPHLKLFAIPYLFKGNELVEHDWVGQHQEANQVINEAVKVHKALNRKIILYPLRLKIYFVQNKESILKSNNYFLKYTYIFSFYTFRFISKIKEEKYYNYPGYYLLELIKYIKRIKTRFYNFIRTQKARFYNFIRTQKARFLAMKNTINKSNNYLLRLFYNTLYYSLRFVWRIRKRLLAVKK